MVFVVEIALKNSKVHHQSKYVLYLYCLIEAALREKKLYHCITKKNVYLQHPLFQMVFYQLEHQTVRIRSR